MTLARPNAAEALASAHASASEPATRIALIDNARAIGIVLVVVGHAPGLPAPLITWIFSFHMPLFFMLSGLVVAPARLAMSFGTRARLLARTLLVPYAFYFAVAYVYWLVAKRHGLRTAFFSDLPWWDPIPGFMMGTADGLYVDVVLWFFPCLFVTALAHHALQRHLSGLIVLLVSLGAGLVLIGLHRDADPRWPWSADCAVVALAFYSMGAAWRTRLQYGARRPLPTTLLAAGALCLVASVALSLSTGLVDLNHLRFGRLPALYLPTAMLGISAILTVSRLVPATRFARWLSLNTLVIFPLHFLMFSVITGVAIVVFRLDPALKDSSPWVGVFYTCVALALSRPAADLLDRIAPWLGRSHAGTRVTPHLPGLHRD